MASIIKCGYCPSSSAENVDIPTQYFTHIIYAFLNPDGTFQFNIDDDQATQLKNFTANLHAKSHPVKVLFAVGGSTAAPLLSRMASEPPSRDRFIKSSIGVARRLGFDGIDLDWEYPQSQTEMENLGALVYEWRMAVTNEAYSTQQPPLLLTAAVYCTTTITWPTFARTYPVFTMSANLDFINVKTYDYHRNWQQNTTSAFAALHDPRSSVNTDASINSWAATGAPRGKLIMGLPLYGRTWKLVNPAVSNCIGALANGVGPGDGEMTYAQVVQFNQANHAKVVHDPATESVYSVAGNDWISYDDSRSVRAKIQYAKAVGLGGHFFWPVTGDYQWTLSKVASESW